MRKVFLSSILLFFIALTSFAQTDSIIYLKVPMGLGGGANTKFLTTTGNIIAISAIDSTKQLFVADTLTGGTFNQYFGNDAVDSAIIFQDALGRKWKRNIPNGAINILWFGALPYPSDSYTPIMRAISYQLSHKGTTIYIPNSSNYFYSSQTIVLNGSVVIKGDPAPLFGATSQLFFPGNKVGIRLSLGQLTMSDLYLGRTTFSTPDSTAHGVELHGIGIFNNVYIYGSSGNNLHVDACATNGTNSDQSTFTNCAFHQSLNNGVYLTGCDANIIIFTNCRASDNAHWGFYDNGFLGNTYVQCQAANDGNAQDVVVNYNGRGYAARNLIGTNNVNQKPDAANSNYWLLSEGYGSRVAWDSTKKYYSGGPYATSINDAKTLFTNCYSEGSQPPSMLSSRGLNLMGLNGAGQTTGAALSVLESIVRIGPALIVGGDATKGFGGITAGNYLKAPTAYLGNANGDGWVGGNFWFADGRDAQGTGMRGDSAGIKLTAGGINRFFMERMSGNVRIGTYITAPADEKLTVDGNISLNGKLKVNGVVGTTGQVLASAGTGNVNTWINLDTTNIPQLAINTIAIGTKGRVDSIVFNNNGLIHGPATVSIVNKVATVNQTLANQNPFTLLGRGTGVGTPSFLASIDSNYAPTLAVKSTVAAQIASIPKGDSALPGYAIRFDSVYQNNKWTINIKVDSAKIAADTKTGLSVTGTGGTYNQTTGVLNLTGGGGNAVDTTTAQNVRGLKTYVGSTSSDGAPLTEQLSANNWTATGWTGTWGAGFTHTVGNTTALTNTAAATSGQLYQITWTVTARTAGSFSIMYGGVTYNMSGLSATGNSGPLAISTGSFSVTPTTDFDGTIVLSVKNIGVSSPNAVWASSDLSNLFQIRIPTSAYSIGQGLNALRRITTGTNNLAIGSSSQQNTTSGSGNVTYGTNALASNTVGSYNSVVGANSGQNTTGDNNNYHGYFAGSANTTGSNNVAIGSLSLFNSTTGSNNTVAGNNAGRYVNPSAALVNCNNCAFFGADTKAGADGLSFATAIGAGAVSLPTNYSVQIGTASNQVVSLTGRVITGSLTDNGTDQLQVTGTAKITGQLNIPTGTISTSAVNLAQMNAAITAGAGSTGGLVDTLNNQNVRGTKTFIGSTATDAAPQSEQLIQANFTSTGWTGTMAAGFTNTASNVTPLTNTAAATVGYYYQLYWTVTNWTTGSFSVAFGGINQSGLTATGNSGGVPANSTATYSITPTSNFNGTIVPSVKYIGVSNANAVWASSDNTSNLFQLRIPANAYSIGLGTSALRRITTGINNLAIGGTSQQNTTSGTGNVSFGTNTLAANSTGSNNTVMGLYAGGNNTLGYNNSYIGNYAGSGNTIGYNNVAVGGLSLLNATTAMGTTAVGNDAGRYIGSGTVALTSCTNCTFLGNSTRAGADGLSNVTALGNGAISPAVSNSTQIGGSANTLINLTGRTTLGGATDNGTDMLQVTGSANITGQLNIPNGTLTSSAVNLGQLNASTANIVSSSYTTSLTNVTNAASSAAGSAVYMRIGNLVHVRTTGTISPTATGATVINISLPITTATASQGTVGTVTVKENGGTSYVGGEVSVNTTTTVQMKYLATSTSTATYTLEFDYQL